MAQTQSVYVKRIPVDRRSPVDRRILDMGPGYPGPERRTHKKNRRRGWEDRYGWERISRWSSSPTYSDLP
ncbi:MAG: hypothetical protein KKE62_09535 [Proteobacteria bacterium]|nr:hypothetical protein [Pseudomonadota bacterium]MBU1388732.1 hypothetical protein [Pseudomonadota bacterium]MBU1543073.1 hypothetical protein [Pseudomonadota bacterium]MBU2481823.1 hypothetical protein [Pseudomonadota bacterium]